MLNLLPLVAEFELQNRRALDNGTCCQLPYSSVRFDFQKLLIANADVRLMVFEVSDFEVDVRDSEKELDVYFEKAIEGYGNLKGAITFSLPVTQGQLYYA